MTTQKGTASKSSTGIPGLDDVLAGGFPPGHLYLVEGDPGVGKTTLGMQFLMAGASGGNKQLYITLSETANELRGVAESHGWDLSGVEIHEVIPSADIVEGDDNTLFHPSEVELGETTRAFLREVERINPSRIVIDSLSEVRLLAQTALRYRRQILAFKQVFAERGCTVLLLDDRSEEPGDMLAVAQDKRPEIAEIHAQQTVSEIQVEARKSDVMPRVDIVAAYARRGLAGSINPDAENFNGGPITVPPPLLGSTARSYGTIGENRFPDASIGLSFSVPITNRTARAALAIANSQLQQAKVDITATRQQVEAEVRNAASALDTARSRIESSKAARVAAETQLYAEQERFNVGLSTNFLVLTRQNDLTQARVTETNALSDYRRAATELERATGTLLERRQITLDTQTTTPSGRR